jgi:hypothetical protein
LQGAVADLAVAGDLVVDRSMAFDWAAAANGARVASADGPDFTRFGCGPRGAIDGSIASGWGSSTGRPRAVTIRLPRAVNVSAFGVDPAAVCGDRDAAALRSFAILTRTRRGHWIEAVDRRRALPLDRLSVVRPRRGRRRVVSVRLVMRSNRGDRRFIDMAELSVRGPAP